MPSIVKPGLWNVQQGYTDPDWLWAWRGLVFAVAPGGAWRHDLISGNIGTLLTSGNWRGMSRHGVSLSSTSTSNGGAYWSFHDRILTLTRSYTIIVWADPSSSGLADGSKLLCIPYRVNTWISPWVAISLGRDGTTSNGASDYASDGSTNIGIGSSTGFIQDTDPLTMYAFTRNGAAGAFYRNAAAWGTGTFSSNLNVDWTNKQPVVLLNHSNSSNGEGMNGTAPLAMLYNRALTANEIKALYVDPYGFMQLPPLQKFYSIGKAPAAAPSTRIKDMITSDGVFPQRR